MDRETRGRKTVKWRPFKEAREWIRNLNLSNFREYRKYLRGEFKELPQIPNDIPKTPDVVVQYADKWNGYSDWLGTPGKNRLSAKAFKGTANYGYRKVIKLPLKLEEKIAKDACKNFRSATKQIEFILTKHYKNGLE